MVTVDTGATWTIDGGATVNSGTAVATGTITGDAAELTTMVITGAGTVAVTNLDETDAADLSNITATTHTANVSGSNTSFTGDLGDAALTVASGTWVVGNAATISNAASIVATGTIQGDAAILTGATITGAGTVAVTNLQSTEAANLNNITATTHTASVSASNTNFTGDIGDAAVTVDTGATWTIDGGATVNSGTAVATGTITGVAAELTTMAITGAGTVAVTNLHATVNADLSNITATTHTATASTDFSFSGQLGTANVILLDGVDMTVTAGEAKGNTFTGTAGGNAETILVTLANENAADKNADLTTITLATEATLASVTVTDSLTFTGTLHSATVTSVADSAVLSLVAAKAHDKTIDKSGTTGKVIADATVDAGLRLAGSAHHDVTNLISALDASGVTGNLAVTLAADTASSVVVGGTGTNTIDGDLLTDSQTLTITGDKAVSVSLVAGDVDASAVTVSAVTVTATTGSNIIQTGAGADELTGGAAVDTFVFGATDSLIASMDVIKDFASNSDIIDHVIALTIGGAADGATVANANIDTNGLATFAGADDELAEMIAAVAANLEATNSNTAGKTAIFVLGTDTYAFITDAAGGNTTGDTLIQLEGASGAAFDTITVTDGAVTIG